MSTFTISVEDAVFKAVPDYKRIVVACTVVAPAIGAQRASDLVAAAVEDIRSTVSTADVVEMLAVDAWRSAFRTVGINPSKFRPAMEALLRRAARGDDLRLGSTLIDLGTAVSLATLCPVGMHTVDRLDQLDQLGQPDGLDVPPDAAAGHDEKRGALSLRLATGWETFVDFSGETTKVDAGELIYAYNDRVLTRRWAWRQGRLGAIRGDEPQHLAVNLDVLIGDGARPLDLTLDLLAGCGAEAVTVSVLDANSPTAQVTYR